MLHLDQSVKGRYIKIGADFIKLDRISKVKLLSDSAGRRLVIDHKDKRGVAKQLTYAGPRVDYVKQQLNKELPNA